MEKQTLNTNNQTNGFNVSNNANELTQNLPSTRVIQTDVVATPQQPIPLPQTQPRPVTQPTNMVDGALNQLKLNESEQQAVNAEQNITARMLEDIAGLEGQSAFQNQLLEQSNIKQLRTDLQGLNSRILQKEAEIAQDDVKLIGQLRAEERRDTLLPFAQSAQARIQGDAQIVRALKMAEIGVLNAQAIGKQGDIQLARQFVDDAVNARYAPYKERIETGRMQLEAIKPFLSRAEQKQAKSLDIKVNQAIKEIDRVSAFQTKLLNNAIEAQASPSVIDAIMRGSSIQEIAKAGRGYEMSRAEKLENQLKNMQIARLSSEIASSGASGEKLTADQRKTQLATANLVSLLNDYKSAITGVGFFSANRPAKRTELLNLKGRIAAEYKQAKQLGTLDAGVERLINQIVPDPGKLSISSLSNEAQIKAIDDTIKDFAGNNNLGGLDSYLNTVDQVSSSPQAKISDYLNSLPKIGQ